MNVRKAVLLELNQLNLTFLHQSSSRSGRHLYWYCAANRILIKTTELEKLRPGVYRKILGEERSRLTGTLE